MSDNELLQILNETCIPTSGTNGDYDLCTTYGQKKYWKIRDAFNFWYKYCTLASPYKLLGETQKELNLAEKQINLVPLIFDINLKFSRPKNIPENELGEHIPLTENFLLQMISCIQEVLKNNFILEYASELLCSFFYPENYVITATEILIKLRLHFPYFKTHPDVQKQIIFPKSIEIFRERNIIGALSKQPLNDWSGIIDTTIMEKSIPLYGSTNHQKEPPFVYQNTVGLIEWSDILDITSQNDEEDNTSHLSVDFGESFHPKVHSHCQKYSILEQYFDCGMSIEYWLPMIFSVNYYYKEVQLTSEELPKILNSSSIQDNAVYISPTANSLLKEFRNKISRNKISELEMAQQFLR